MDGNGILDMYWAVGTVHIRCLLQRERAQLKSDCSGLNIYLPVGGWLFIINLMKSGRNAFEPFTGVAKITL